MKRQGPAKAGTGRRSGGGQPAASAIERTRQAATVALDRVRQGAGATEDGLAAGRPASTYGAGGGRTESRARTGLRPRYPKVGAEREAEEEAARREHDGGDLCTP
jgi:hypothetical protein